MRVGEELVGVPDRAHRGEGGHAELTDFINRVRHQPGANRLVEFLLVAAADHIVLEARVFEQVPQAGGLQEGDQLRAAGVAEEDVAVLALVDAGGVPHARLGVALAHEHVAGVSPHRGGVLVHRDHALDVRDLDGLAQPDRLACEQPRHRADETVHAARILGVSALAAERLAVGLAVQVHVPAHRIVGEDVGAPVRRWPLKPVGRDVYLDGALVGAARSGRDQAIGGAALDDHVGHVEQTVELGAPGDGLRVQLDNLFAGVAVGPDRADRVVAQRVAGQQRARRAQRIAARRLHLDDSRAVVGEHLCRERAGV